MKVGKKELQKRSFPNSYLNCNYQRDKGLMITLSLGEICEKVGMRHHLLFGLSADQEREKYDWFKRKIPFVLSRAMEEKDWETISLSQTRRARESLVETA